MFFFKKNYLLLQRDARHGVTARMPLAAMRSFTFSGIEVVPVKSHCQFASGLPAFLVVGPVTPTLPWVSPSQIVSSMRRLQRYQMLPPPPRLGSPASHVAVKWLQAPDDQPFMYWDEVDGDRWSIRCVRKYRSGVLEAYSYESDNWRDVMPDAAIPPLVEMNSDPEFEAVEISASEFEAIWREANGLMSPSRP